MVFGPTSCRKKSFIIIASGKLVQAEQNHGGQLDQSGAAERYVCDGRKSGLLCRDLCRGLRVALHLACLHLRQDLHGSAQEPSQDQVSRIHSLLLILYFDSHVDTYWGKILVG